MSLAPMMTRNAWALACAVICLGCTSGQEVWSSDPTEFPFAYIHDDCAPWDGHAITIVLSHQELAGPYEANFPFVRITSWRPPTELAGSSLGWTGIAHDLGYASWCDAEDSCLTASAVRVRFERGQTSSDALEGQLHLEFEGGRAVSGAFNARRLSQQALCG